MNGFQGAAKKEGRWFICTDDKGQNVALCLDHVANVYVKCHNLERPDFGSFSLVFVMVNGREVYVGLRLTKTVAGANRRLEHFLKEIQ